MALATASTSTQERHGAVTFKGNPLTLIGPKITVGSKAPDFQVLAQDLSPVSLASAASPSTRTTASGRGLAHLVPSTALGARQDSAPRAPVGLHKTLLVSVVPSLDTPVCDAQTKRFNQEAATLPNVEILTVSMDLPFAQKRWCGAGGIDKVKLVSDHKDASFGKAYGVLIKELRLLARAIFLIDRGGTVRYVEYVPEVTSHPNYDAALAAVRQLTQ